MESITATSDNIRAKIDSRSARVGIIGLGYVGLPLALLFCEQRLSVTGFDIDDRKVSLLGQGSSYIVRIPPTEIQTAKQNGFAATSDYGQIGDMDAVIICVPTPLDDFRQPDLSYIKATAEAVAPHLRAGQLIVLGSTTYPGTTEEVLVPILEKNARGLSAQRESKGVERDRFYVAFSPEREDPANNTVARCDIPKVVGGLSGRATALASAL